MWTLYQLCRTAHCLSLLTLRNWSLLRRCWTRPAHSSHPRYCVDFKVVVWWLFWTVVKLRWLMANKVILNFILLILVRYSPDEHLEVQEFWEKAFECNLSLWYFNIHKQYLFSISIQYKCAYRFFFLVFRWRRLWFLWLWRQRIQKAKSQNL